MSDLHFVWNDRKSATNLRKHGVSFAEAQTVFLDEDALLLPDPDHSDTEDRFILIGLSSRVRVLIVCHCYRERGDVIRLISARKAVAGEQMQYERRKRR